MSFQTVSVIGLGYIGLPTAAIFASKGRKVIGIDVNQYVVDTINNGKIHIVEPELDLIVQSAVRNGYLKAAIEPEPADAFLIAVPTPFKSDTNNKIPAPDLTYIKSASEMIAPVLKKGDLVILESTSPVGTTEQLASWLAKIRPDLSFPHQKGNNADINIAYCPERVLPGNVIKELIENDRVIGGMSERCSARAVSLYKTFVQGDCIITNAPTAEMTKLTENSSRDVQIAFANELSVICDKLSINVWELISLANRHPRVNILQPGPGVGGHCIAVDPWFIVSKTPKEATLIHTARVINDRKPNWVIDKTKIAIADFLANNPSKTISDVTVACYGLAFKADIDDLRESPALGITTKLAEETSARIIAVEPNIISLPNNINNIIRLVDFDYAYNNADIHVLLVNHSSFMRYNFNKSLVIDTKGMKK